MRFDVIILRLVFAAFLISAGYVLHPIPGHKLISAGFAFRIGDPEWCALVLARSGLGHRDGLVLGNAVGLIDADYEGTCLISAWNRTPPRSNSRSRGAVLRKTRTCTFRSARLCNSSSNTGIQVYIDTSSMENYTFCGLGDHCSIATGQPTQERGRLVRREALEVALYTFKFAPAINSVTAFMTPPPGQTTSQILYLRKDDLKDQLKQPLLRTLPLATPPLPSAADSTEASTIDKLTLPHMFTYSLTALQNGGAALILDPAT